MADYQLFPEIKFEHATGLARGDDENDNGDGGDGGGGGGGGDGGGSVAFDLKYNSCICITEEVSMLLRKSRLNTNRINEIHWPIGASDYATAKFLVHNRTAAAMASSSSGAFKIDFGGLTFTMYFKGSQPLLGSSVNSPDISLVEFVDARYFWNQETVTSLPRGEGDYGDGLFYGINISNPRDRQDLLHQTTRYDEDETSATWTGRDVLEALLVHKQHVLGDEFYWDGLDLLESGGRLGEYHFTGQPLGEVIDYVLQCYGCCFVALPNEDVAIWGKTYQIQRISDGKARAESQIQGYSHLLVSGGINNIELEGYSSSIPESVEVHFPVSVVDFKYRKDANLAEVIDANYDPGEVDDFNFTTDRYRTIISETGRGEKFGKTKRKPIYSHKFAIFEEVPEDDETPASFNLLNQNEINISANVLSEIYYSRFSCGDCNVEMKGILGGPMYDDALELWAGAQMVVWSISLDGPKTVITGTHDCPLFGFVPDKLLKQSDLHSIGGARALPRSSGGVLLEGSQGQQVTMDLYLGEITEVFGPEQGQSIIGYSAEAYNNPKLTEKVIANIVPERMHNPAEVDIVPAEIGSVCIIGVIPPGGLQGGGGQRNLPTKRFTKEAIFSAIDIRYPGNGLLLPPDAPSSMESGMDHSNVNRYSNELEVIAHTFGPIGEIYSRGFNRVLPDSPGTSKAAVQRFNSKRSDMNEEQYVLFVWEYPKVVACYTEEDPEGRSMGSGSGFFNSYQSRLAGY